MLETIGIVKEVKHGGVDATAVIIEYEVDGKKYFIKELIKLKIEVIKIWKIPIGMRGIPKVDCRKGNSVTILYDPQKPNKGHIKGNDGILV